MDGIVLDGCKAIMDFPLNLLLELSLKALYIALFRVLGLFFFVLSFFS